MKPKGILEVWMNGVQVGSLALTPDRRAAFEYSPQWLMEGYSISPLSLPLRSGVFIPRSYEPNEGLFGVFAHSLPDGWGRLLVDRMLKSHGIDPYTLNVLDRLALVGSSGRGALEYRPAKDYHPDFSASDLDELQKECSRILQDQPSDSLDTLYLLGGSSGGARPKIQADFEGSPWLIKFPASFDPTDIGKEEFDYYQCAGHCGLEIPEIRLFPSSICPGYFGSRRFDRKGDQKIHMLSAAALLETTHRIPNLDYEQLLKLTWILTSNMSEVIKMFRLACFNVFSHNRDDHSANFSFLCENGRWRVSPAYDLTWSSSFGGEHAATVHGNGRNPGEADLLECARSIGIPDHQAKEIIHTVSSQVRKDLDIYLERGH